MGLAIKRSQMLVILELVHMLFYNVNFTFLRLFVEDTSSQSLEYVETHIAMLDRRSDRETVRHVTVPPVISHLHRPHHP